VKKESVRHHHSEPDQGETQDKSDDCRRGLECLTVVHEDSAGGCARDKISTEPAKEKFKTKDDE
jgi:hypothetical protein